MGKRSKRGGRGGGGSGGVGGGEGSTSPAEDGEENGQQDYALNHGDSSAESDVEEQLVDKRGFMRMGALEELEKTLRPYSETLPFDSATSVAEKLCRVSIKRGGDEESDKACRLLAMLFINEGDSPETSELFHKLKTILLQKRTPSALEALGMACFVGAEDETTTLRTMASLESFFTKAGRAEAFTMAAAVRAWTLVATTLSPDVLLEYVLGERGRSAGLAIRRYAVKEMPMGEGPRDLKLAATGALSVVLEMTISEEDSDEEEDDEDTDGGDLTSFSSIQESMTGSLIDVATSPKILSLSSLETALDRVSDGLSSGRKKISSKDKALRKKIAAELESDVVIEIGNREVVELHRRVDLTRLNAFRSILESGSSDHLAYNPFLRDVFELGDPLARDASANPNSRRYFGNAKTRSRSRAEGRQYNNTRNELWD
uniref:Interferon-related developmental regulator N-terminal domain-containing protein n=1 Tax=Rhodosorus marinus TaxID=101924 RepID=A0A7S0BD31_9RHOD|mmetsp:Transcript_1078/g.1724  ORF Transcript_1078/g.1724 Transcript_1078/m.1724 type:complete len:431 (+) Transcript_1078:86-1378(+)